MAQLRVVVLWHQHQPFYKDLVTGLYRLPWVRLHALKDYYGMVALLREFPQVHQTFNLVPSMIEQLKAYCDGSLVDEHAIYARENPANLTESDRRWIVENFFAANIQNMIELYPRYSELFAKKKAKTDFDDADIRDLQVWFRLCWFDY